MGQFSVVDFYAHNNFMPRHVPSAEVNSAVQKYCQRGPSFANGDQELFTSEVIVFLFETKGTQKHCLIENLIDLYATCFIKAKYTARRWKSKANRDGEKRFFFFSCFLLD